MVYDLCSQNNNKLQLEYSTFISNIFPQEFSLLKCTVNIKTLVYFISKKTISDCVMYDLNWCSISTFSVDEKKKKKDHNLKALSLVNVLGIFIPGNPTKCLSKCLAQDCIQWAEMFPFLCLP